MRICASNSPDCSGVIPCEECFEYLRVKVLPRTMFLSGEPFTSNALWAEIFMRSFAQAMHESVMEIRVEAPLPEPSPEPQSPSPFGGMPEAEYLAVFSSHVEENWSSLSPEQREATAKGVADQTMEGWESLSEGERDVLRATFLPPVSVAPPPPLKETVAEETVPDCLLSSENAEKLVAALRQGKSLAMDLLSPNEPSAAAAVDQDLTGEAHAPQSEATGVSVSNIQNNTVTESEST